MESIKNREEKIAETKKKSPSKGNHSDRLMTIVLCPLFSALIAVGAFIKIPVPFVPFTMQLLFVLLAGLILGAARGFLSVSLYIIIGLLGIPVFTAGGGPAYLVHPTFGYLIGFALGSFLCGLIVEKSKKKTFFTYLFASLVSLLLIIYPLGGSYFYLISNYYLAKQLSVGFVILYCCLIFVPADILICILASAAAKRLHKTIDKI